MKKAEIKGERDTRGEKAGDKGVERDRKTERQRQKGMEMMV